MHLDGQIDTNALTAHLSQVCSIRGICGLLLNGHAGEGHLLSHAERGLIIEIARANTSRTCFITAGVTAEATDAAVEEARISASAGADALLVFPPNHWSAGLDPEIALSHHAAIARATDLPLVLYKAPVTAGHISYSEAVMKRLLKELGAIVAIKEGSWEVAAYEHTWRLAAGLRPDVAVLGSGDEHLLTSYLIGSRGSQVSLAAIIPEVIVALYDAAQENDWVSARASHEALYALSVAIYRDAPGYLATARLKACLKLLGRIPDDTVRRPMRQLTVPELTRLQAVLTTSELASGNAA
jgi:4-hydroxy-tetrahydrodipicolinate synthase